RMVPPNHCSHFQTICSIGCSIVCVITPPPLFLVNPRVAQTLSLPRYGLVTFWSSQFFLFDTRRALQASGAPLRLTLLPSCRRTGVGAVARLTCLLLYIY